MSNRGGEKTEFGPGKTALYYNNNGLFSDPFLEDRLPNIEKYYNNPSTRFLNDYWNIDESNATKYNEAFQRVMDLWHKLDQDVPKYCSKERQVQNTWIDPIFKILGWEIELEEASTKNGITNFPDYALYASVEDWKKSKDLVGNNKFKKATAVADAKDWGVSLDGKGFSNKNPSFQIINYLKQTDKTWGILTDGKYWRIYSLRSNSKHTTFYEIDLEKILASGDYERFKYFYNFFRVEAFIVDSKLSDRSFLDFVFEDGKFYAQLVDKNLNERVYKIVDSICHGFLNNYSNPTEIELKEVYSNSMYYLFKLMFILNCESKGLLEVNKQDDYYDFSLRKKCLELKEQMESGKNWSSQPRTYNFVNDLFNLLKTGDHKIGVHGFGDEPFEIGSQEFYRKNKIGDDYLNTALLDLSCNRDEEGNLQFIDYKILSPDHIGSLFEGLLEFDLIKSGKKIELLNTKGERKATGSFYTPDYIVDYIVEKTLQNKIEKKSPTEILNFKVLDPAMGSGHFLLGIVKYLEHAIVEFQNFNADVMGGIEFDKIRKEVLKNCVFGVDINPLATQLAKFSMWIYTSQKGDFLEPLSDQFKSGNSLIEDLPVEKNKFIWSTEFKEILRDGGFDAIVGNPPYIFARDNKFSTNEKEYLVQKYKWSRFQINSAQFFVELSYRLMKNGGHLGFILPNTWLSIQTSDSFRESLLQNSSEILIVNSFDKIFEAAVVDNAILIATKFENSSQCSLSKQLLEKGKFKVLQKNIPTVPTKDVINCTVTLSEDSASSLVGQNYKELGSFCTVKSGLKAYETGKGSPKQTDKMKKDRVYHHTKKINSKCKKYLEGKDVKRFDLGWSGEFLEYGSNLASPRSPELFNQIRILVRQIPSKPPYCINACVVSGEELNDINSIIVLPDDPKDVYYICAILNSKLISDWFIEKYDKFQRKVFPQFKVNELATFPIPKDVSADAKKQLSDLAKKITAKAAQDEVDSRSIDELNDKIDSLVMNLFKSPKRLKKAI